MAIRVFFIGFALYLTGKKRDQYLAKQTGRFCSAAQFLAKLSQQPLNFAINSLKELDILYFLSLICHCSQTLFAHSMPVFYFCQLKFWVWNFGIDCEAKLTVLLLRNSMIKIFVTAWFAFPPQLILTDTAEEHSEGSISPTVWHSRAPVGRKESSFFHFDLIRVNFLFVSTFSLFIEEYR